MKYSKGDRVKTNQDLDYANRTVLPAGSKGTIEKVYATSKSYLVNLKNGQKRISERFLDPA